MRFNLMFQATVEERGHNLLTLGATLVPSLGDRFFVRLMVQETL